MVAGVFGCLAGRNRAAYEVMNGRADQIRSVSAIRWGCGVVALCFASVSTVERSAESEPNIVSKVAKISARAHRSGSSLVMWNGIGDVPKHPLIISKSLVGPKRSDELAPKRGVQIAIHVLPLHKVSRVELRLRHKESRYSEFANCRRHGRPAYAEEQDKLSKTP
jgi:hypothetical protein